MSAIATSTGWCPVSGAKTAVICRARPGAGTAQRARTCTFTRPPLTMTPATLRPGR